MSEQSIEKLVEKGLDQAAEMTARTFMDRHIPRDLLGKLVEEKVWLAAYRIIRNMMEAKVIKGETDITVQVRIDRSQG